MFGMGMKELLVVAGVMVLLFGAKKIPALAKGIGQGVKELRHGFEEKDDAEDNT